MKNFSNLFKGKKVVIMGLGLHGGGVGVANFFIKQKAQVTITDLKKEKDLKESLVKIKQLSKVTLILGRHRKEDFKNADLIVKNPAVPPDSPFLNIAYKNNIPVKTDIDIFFEICSAPIIGVTGTKGKSTTSTLIYLFLKTKFPKTFLAGNIGVSPLEIVSQIDKNSKVVLELSSFELESLKKSPHIAVITSLFPDHLDRYKNFNNYLKSKESIFRYQKKSDILILNYGDLRVRKLGQKANSKIYYFKTDDLKKENIDFPSWIEPSNIAAALLVAKIFKVPKKEIKKVLANFKGIKHRQELVAVKKGIYFVNDTAATTPQSVILAIKLSKKRFPGADITLIAGGVDKGLKYKQLVQKIKKEVANLILLPGSASEKIRKELGSKFELYLARDMEDAVKKAIKTSKKGDLIILSPGAASFNLFRNEFDRGEKFIKIIKKL